MNKHIAPTFNQAVEEKRARDFRLYALRDLAKRSASTRRSQWPELAAALVALVSLAYVLS